MPNRVTRFAYIMDRMGVRAGVLARETGIDKTLISRWRTGRRRLSATSVHAEKIVDYLLSVEGAKEKIGRTMNGYGLDEETGTLKENLIFWISEQDIPVKGDKKVNTVADGEEYISNFRVFLGYRGLKKAIATGLDYVMSKPGKKNVMVVMHRNRQWITAEPEFLAFFLERLHLAFNSGVTFTVFSRNKFNVDDIASFIGPWLAAHLRGYVRSYYFEEADSASDSHIICAAKNTACMTMRQDLSVADGLYIGMFTDEVTVNQVYNVCKTYRNIGKQPFKYGFLDKPGNFFKSFAEESIKKASCYVYSCVPCFGAIPVERAHSYAQVTQKESKQKVREMEALYYTPDQYKNCAQVRHVFCLDCTEELTSRGRHQNYALSAAYGKRVNHSRKRVAEQLENILRWMEECPHYQAVFVPERVFGGIPIEFVCAEKLYSIAWLKGGRDSTCLKEKNKTDALFGYAELLWNKLPKTYKNRKKTIGQLKQWIVACNVTERADGDNTNG